MQDKIEVAMEHGDTWRLWGPHKLEILSHMESGSYNFESMGRLKFLGLFRRLIHLAICIIGQILEEM